MMIRFPPTLAIVAIVAIVRRLKQISTNQLWKMHGQQLKKQFRIDRTFWSDGYFVCSTGDASTDTINKYRISWLTLFDSSSRLKIWGISLTKSVKTETVSTIFQPESSQQIWLV